MGEQGSKDHVLEKDKPLSESLLWELQLRAYRQFGLSAWTEKGVPSYLTSHPLTAAAYAKIVVGYLKDCLAQSSSLSIKEDAPFYLFDLGAGSGRFAYLFLRELLPALKQTFRNRIKICYVLTDVVADNLAFCQKHPYFHSWIEEGLLDFAAYIHSQEEASLELLSSKRRLSTFENPIILIANYFFDTIPQDAFRIEEGKLQEALISLSVQDRRKIDLKDPEIISHLKCSYRYLPISKNRMAAFSSDEKFLLNSYQKTSDFLTFSIPTGALQVFKTFGKLSKGRMLLLAADQGACTLSQLQEWKDPAISLHGSFSFAVNYHAVALLFALWGGTLFCPAYPDKTFATVAGVLGGNKGIYTETQAAFDWYLSDFGPKDYKDLVIAVENQGGKPSLEELFLLLKLGRWDPMNLHAFFQWIRNQLPSASENDKGRIASAIHEAWERYFPLSPAEGDFILNLGVLLYELGRIKEALVFFLRARDLAGDLPSIRHNISLCEEKLRNPSI